MAPSRRLDVNTLRQCGITIHAEDYPSAIIANIKNDQAANLARALLNFRHLIPREELNDMTFEEQAVLHSTKRHILIPEDQPNSKIEPLAYERYNVKYKNGKVSDVAQRVNQAYRVVTGAQSIVSTDETRWNDLMSLELFKNFRDMALTGEGRGWSSSPREILASFRIEREHTWEFGRKVLRENSAMKDVYQNPDNGLTAPKPDLYMAFNANIEDPSTESNRATVHGDEIVLNFSYYKLHRLAKYFAGRGFLEGFNPGPCYDFAKDSGPYLPDIKNLTCFPWLIGEWKHSGMSHAPTFVHCQAANGAAVALSILAGLAAVGRPRPDITDIRPVVAITSTGPKVKVWIAYVSKVESMQYKYEVHRIWEGRLTDLVEVTELFHIIEQVHFWALNILRPWISGCIDRWTAVMKHELAR